MRGAGLIGALVLSVAAGAEESPTRLGVAGERWTVNGAPTFLYGLSYYGGLGASEETLDRDLEALRRHGFNWVRIWATWAAHGHDVSAVDAEGRPRDAQLDRLRRLLEACDRRGVVVDVTIGRGRWTSDAGVLLTADAHRRAVETLVEALRPRRNWYLDLANERNLTAFGFTSFAELRNLRVRVRELDPERLVTASHAGDIGDADLREYLLTAGVDVLCPHRPRSPESARATARRTGDYRAAMRRIGRVVPIHYQEPFRRDWSDWSPAPVDFEADLRGARAGGAAGWCFHNGNRAAASDGEPRRCFDMRAGPLFPRLDAVERELLPALEIILRQSSLTPISE